jgi:NTE family protein
MVKKVAIGCQGGGMHAAFEVGVLTEILKNIDEQKKQNDIQFELVGLSGTSAGALCALMAWYGLAPKDGRLGSEQEAVDKLKHFWKDFVASNGAETMLNWLTYGLLRAEETEIPVLGINAPIFASPNPYGAIYKMVGACLPVLVYARNISICTSYLPRHVQP